jgi:hypothetical protein
MLLRRGRKYLGLSVDATATVFQKEYYEYFRAA